MPRSGDADREDARELVGRLWITPVLTAHPTEARRRTLLLALRRVRRAARAPRGPATCTPAEDRDAGAASARRSRCSGGRPTSGRSRRARSTRSGRRSRSSTRRCSASSRASPGARRRARPRRPTRGRGRRVRRAPARPPTPGGPARARRCVPAFLRWGSWIGGDRDGNPSVTAEMTERTLRIHADHVLRGYEAVATRLSQTIAASSRCRRRRVARAALATRLARDAELLPELDRQLGRRFPRRAVPAAVRLRRRAAAPDPRLPHRPAGAADRPLRVGRRSSTPSSPRSRTRSSPTASAASRGARSRTSAGSSRRSGSTSPSLEVRQHSAVHRGRARGARRGRGLDGRRASRRASRSARSLDDVRGGRARSRRGSATRRADRYVVSFTASADDVRDVLELARARGGRAGSRPRSRSTSCRCSSTRRRSRPAGTILDEILSRRRATAAPSSGPRRPPGGDARLLRLEQGVGLPRRELAPPPGPGRARRGGAARTASS